MLNLLEKIYHTEIEYVKLFSQSYESDHIIRFCDESIPDMYTHNFVLIKNDYGIDKTKEIILTELAERKKEGCNFLRVEFNFPLENKLLNKLPIKPQIQKYDYMYIDPHEAGELIGNQVGIVRKATSQAVLNDGIEVDILANEPIMGKDFATRRIHRKSEVYRRSNMNLNLYVCYYKETPIGNCEFMLNNGIVKIEDFDILKKYQRMGFGTSVIKHLLNEAKQKEVDTVYLVTDNEDTAKQMYTKCGFKKAGEKIELFFDLGQ